MIIRDERRSDIEAIAELAKAAFENHTHSDHTEQRIVSALRAAAALTVSLVAEIEGAVIGHIAFSPVTISDGSKNWYGLGPVSVVQQFQKQGIGAALVHAGLCRLKALSAKGCVLLGEPAYYERFGFSSFPDLILECIPQEYFMALPFDENKAQGFVSFHHGFAAPG